MKNQPERYYAKSLEELERVRTILNTRKFNYLQKWYPIIGLSTAALTSILDQSPLLAEQPLTGPYGAGLIFIGTMIQPVIAPFRQNNEKTLEDHLERLDPIQHTANCVAATAGYLIGSTIVEYVLK